MRSLIKSSLSNPLIDANDGLLNFRYSVTLPSQESKDNFCDQTDDPEIANAWFLIPLVSRLVGQGTMLKKSQSYAFIKLPVLGGDHLVENVAVRTVAFQYAALGPIFERLKAVLDGAKVQFQVIE